MNYCKATYDFNIPTTRRVPPCVMLLINLKQLIGLVLVISFHLTLILTMIFKLHAFLQPNFSMPLFIRHQYSQPVRLLPSRFRDKEEKTVGEIPDLRRKEKKQEISLSKIYPVLTYTSYELYSTSHTLSHPQ
jgi:hypothetical protein